VCWLNVVHLKQRCVSLSEDFVAVPKPDVQTVTAAELQGDLDAVLDQVSRNETYVVVEREGRPAVAMIPSDELDRLRRLEAEWERPFAVVERMREAFSDLTEEQIEHDVAEVFAEMRASTLKAQEPSDTTSAQT
jgi:prevent-host-death family protein